MLEDRGSGILLTSSSSYPFLFSGGVFYFCHPLYFWWRGTVGRGYIIILKLRGLGDLFLSEGRLIMSERSKVQDKTCYLNGHFRQVTLTSLCLMAPKVPDVCLRKPRLQEETSSILGALAEDKSLSHCPASMAQVRVTAWRGGITKTPRFPSRDRARNLGVRSKLPALPTCSTIFTT